MYSSWEEFWWKQITGPSMVVSSVVQNLINNTMVALKVPADLPWRHYMRGAVEEQFKNQTGLRQVLIEPIDAVDDCPAELNPGQFLIERFGNLEVKHGYRETSKTSIQEYIIENEILKNRIVWVKGLTKRQAIEWQSFCRDFGTDSVESGLFVLEIHGNVTIVESVRLKVVDYSKLVSRDDVRLFNSFLLDESGALSAEWKNYIATVSAMLCDKDAEVSKYLLDGTDFTSESPIEGIERLSKEPALNRRGEDIQSEHVLSYYRANNISILQKRVWIAQVQVLFPIIELERVEIIKLLESDIKKALESYSVKQYGTDVTDPYNVELGTLCYMMKTQEEEATYMLYIKNQNLRDNIEFLKECRNTIAHMGCCNPYDVERIIELYGNISQERS